MYTQKEFIDCSKVGDFAKSNKFVDAFGKIAKKPGTLMGEKLVFKTLRLLGILTRENYPYQKYAHFFKLMPKTYQMGEKVFEKPVPLLTPQGQKFVKEKLEDFLQVK